MSKQRNEHWDSTSELNHNSALVWIKFYLSDSTATSTRSAAKREVDVQVLNHELGTGLVLLDLERNGGEGISFLGSGVKGHEAEGKWLELKPFYFKAKQYMHQLMYDVNFLIIN